MVKQLGEKGYALEENTLYPLLRRLEKKGFIKGKWDVSENRPRKFYIILEIGRAIRRQLLKIWHRQNETLNHLLEENKNAVEMRSKTSPSLHCLQDIHSS